LKITTTVSSKGWYAKEELKEKVLREAKSKQFDVMLWLMEQDGLIQAREQVVW